GLDVVGIRRGYEGLLDGDAIPLTQSSVGGIIHHGGTILRKSDVFETPPVGLTEQPRFLNACVLVKTSMDPQLCIQVGYLL
uniref:2-amino-4-hydroxy-6- hydroxymethyldihydropteridine diphosphokinase n=1 Tax=Acetomicrobium sp. S15 = DSM 107314 TaxID=2529858 RepID=UPI00315968F0